MVTKLDPRQLTTGQQNALRRSEEYGVSFDELAEDIVESIYNLKGDKDTWFDLRHPTTGAKYQVKSTTSKIGEYYLNEGRFRIWQSQNKSMMGSDNANIAWYAFVLFDKNSGYLYVQRRKPKTVNKIVRESGGWNESGHDMGRQYKVRIPDVIEV